MEIAYSLTGYRRVIKNYDWYEIQEKDVFDPSGLWTRVHKGYNRQTIIRRLESPKEKP